MSENYRDRLIEEVKKYPVLYDTRHENHWDIPARDRCWLDIAERLGENSEVLKREWKSLRDSYRQAIKKSRKGATTKAGVPCKKWRYQARMNFILPFMTTRRKHRLLNTRKNRKTEESEPVSEVEQEAESWEPGGADDAVDLFFASLCLSTKRLPRKYQNQLKRQFLDALLKVEEEAEADAETGDAKAESVDL